MKTNIICVLLWLVAGAIFAQPDDASWLNVTVQTDNYGGESSWEIINSDSNTVAASPPLADNSLTNIMVFLPAGEYSFIMYDSFGDGICCSFGQGFFGITNTCGLEEFNYEFDGAIDTIPFVLDPCLPVLLGCMNEAADNYNPWANQDDGSCEIIECDSLETQVTMELTLDTWPGETGFNIVNLSDGQLYEQVIPGEFDFGDQLVTYTYDFCVALGFELVLIDQFGDGLNGSESGGEDGACVITACDSVIWELEDLAFSEFTGNTEYSGPIFTEPCPPAPDVIGCMDDDYVDYNPLATVQDTCETLHVWGCLDPEAFNYDSLATISDNNSPCSITLTLEDDAGDGWGMSGVGMKQGDQQWLFTIGPGIFSESWDIMLDEDEEVDIYYFQDGGQQSSAQELAFQTLHNSILVTNENGDTLLAEGQNPFLDNGQGALQPFKAPSWPVYHFEPYCGNSCEPYSYGCTDMMAQNYDANVNTEDGSCYYQSGCTQAGYLEYYTQGYEADYDNGSCQTIAIFGCMDEEAFNYSPEANVDNEGCIPVVLGCTNPLAFNYNSAANTDDDSCIPYIYGCTDATMFNYDPEANTDDNSCIPYIYGCTDSSAFNYDPTANADNGSCIDVVEDCADPAAFNYNVEANVSNPDACLYDAGCITGPGNPYWLNDPCYAWVIDVDPYCCETGWDNSCIDLYSYCYANFVGIPDIHDVYGVYPNPTTGVVVVNSLTPVLTSVYNNTGQKVLDGISTNRIDLSELANGTYVVVMHTNGRVFKQTIIKQ